MAWADEHLARDALIDTKRSAVTMLSFLAEAAMAAGYEAKARGDFDAAAKQFEASKYFNDLATEILSLPDPPPLPSEPPPANPPPAPNPSPAPADEDDDEDRTATAANDARPPDPPPDDGPPSGGDGPTGTPADGGDDRDTGGFRWRQSASSARLFAGVLGLLTAPPHLPGAPGDPDPDTTGGRPTGPITVPRPAAGGDGVTDPSPEATPAAGLHRGRPVISSPAIGFTDPTPLLAELDAPALRRVAAQLLQERARLRAMLHRGAEAPPG